MAHSSISLKCRGLIAHEKIYRLRAKQVVSRVFFADDCPSSGNNLFMRLCRGRSLSSVLWRMQTTVGGHVSKVSPSDMRRKKHKAIHSFRALQPFSSISFHALRNGFGIAKSFAVNGPSLHCLHSDLGKKYLEPRLELVKSFFAIKSG